MWVERAWKYGKNSQTIILTWLTHKTALEVSGINKEEQRFDRDLQVALTKVYLNAKD